MIHELVNKRALDELIFRQAIAVDRRDWLVYRECFDDDVDFDLADHVDPTIGKDSLRITRAEEWVKMVRQTVSGFDSTQHLISNTCHTIQGDRAETVCQVLADHFLTSEQGQQSLSGGAIYTIGSIRTTNGWKIRTWHVKGLWFRGNPDLFRLAAKKQQDSGKS